MEGQPPVKVRVHEPQADPVSGRFIHVDLHQIRMDEKVRAEVEIEFVGEAPAVKELGGNLVLSRDTVAVECLPADLPPKFTIDVSSLATYEDSIHLKDLAVSEKVHIVDD